MQLLLLEEGGQNVMPLPTSEMVLNRQQLKRLSHPLIITPSDCVQATVSAERLSDIIQSKIIKTTD